MDFTEFQNSAGKKIFARFREFQDDDAGAIVNLIREEYGEKYHTPSYYDEKVLIQLHREKKVIFFVAELRGGEIIGCLHLRRYLPRETTCSMGTGVIAKSHRNYHLFGPLINYVMEQIKKIPDAPSIAATLVMYHVITQKLIDGLGLTLCGFIPQMVLADSFQHSYDAEENLKYTFIFTVYNIRAKDVGKIFLPVEHKDIAKKIYDSLKVSCNIISEETALRGESKILVEDSPTQQNCTISIDEAGEDLREKISAIENARQLPFQTFNVFLNISDEKSIAAYKILRELGYCFAGFKPLGGAREIMIMHNPKNVSINFDELKAIEKYVPLKNYFRKCYESR